MGNGASFLRVAAVKISSAQININIDTDHHSSFNVDSEVFSLPPDCVEIVYSDAKKNKTNKSTGYRRMSKNALSFTNDLSFHENQNPSDVVLISSSMVKSKLYSGNILESFPCLENLEFEMTRSHVDMLSKSWKQVRSGTDFFINQNHHTSPLDLFADTFYEMLFQRMPEVGCLFRQQNIQAQRNAFNKMVGTTVTLMQMPKDLVKSLQCLGDRHYSYGRLKPIYFEIFGDCMVEALQRCSGTKWDNNIDNSWKMAVSLSKLIMMPRILFKKLEGDESSVLPQEALRRKRSDSNLIG